MLLNVSQQSLRLEKTVVNIIVINDRSNFEFELSTLVLRDILVKRNEILFIESEQLI